VYSIQFTNSTLACKTELSLHCRQSRYFCKRDPLQLCGEAATKLAEDLKTIAKKVKARVMNPGSIPVVPHLNYSSSRK
jgi:hypothetical protein